MIPTNTADYYRKRISGSLLRITANQSTSGLTHTHTQTKPSIQKKAEKKEKGKKKE